ncbi:MAG: tyrosine--tRNA ligase [Patescibacteria group bacterium]|nr:tyrosine--tRNA ligase [Patescibacteria group bacterium]
MPEVITDKSKIKELLTRGVKNIYPAPAVLEKVLMSDKKLKLYLGIDPTGPTLHLGHLVQILKLKQFQDLGHKIILLIGDFTAQIGDPSDKAAVRKQLTYDQVMENCQSYKEQIGKILDLKKVEFKFNSKWLGKLNFADIIKLSSYFTAQQTLARDMFKKRIEAGKDLFLHEFLYPLMQAYDSVFMDVDLEVGGNDQMFNMMAGRTLMKKMKNKEKFVLTTKLLEDPTGKKMGKTEGNMVALNFRAEDMYGKIMSWPDGFIAPGFELATRVSAKELLQVYNDLKNNKINPRDLKMKLAREIVKMFHGEKKASEAEKYFVKTIQKKGIPDEIKEVKINVETHGDVSVRNMSIINLLVKIGLAGSKSEARRLIEQGGIRADGKVIKNINQEIKIGKDGILIQRGKRRFVRVKKS